MTTFEQRRTAIVTGAGAPDGIGFAIARRLLLAGMNVVIGATSERIHERRDELVAELSDPGAGQRVRASIGDLSHEAGAVAIVEAAVSAFGGVDVLVNNAGMTSVTDPQDPAAIDGIGLEGWNHALQRNLTTSFLVTRAALPWVNASPAGRIIMMSSVSGPLLAYRGDIGYHAAKAGMVGLVRGLAVDVAGHGTTVNAIAPGWIHTGSATPHEDAMGLATPLQRSGTPDEVAAVAEFLASEGASYVTGQLLVVDGGNSIQDEKG